MNASRTIKMITVLTLICWVLTAMAVWERGSIARAYYPLPRSEQPAVRVAGAGGQIVDGPLYAVDTSTVFADPETGSRYVRVSPLHFKDTDGKWRVLVFITIDPPAAHRKLGGWTPAWTQGRMKAQVDAGFMVDLKKATAGLSDTEVWAVRMNHYVLGTGDILGLLGLGFPDSGWGAACRWTTVSYLNGTRRFHQHLCFDRFVYAGVVAGADGTYFWPQVDWFNKTFPFLSSMGQAAGNAVVIVDPHGRFFYDWQDECPKHVGTDEQLHNCMYQSAQLKNVLYDLNAARIGEGYSPILARALPSHTDVLSFDAYVRGGAE